jgi:transposase
MIEIGMDQHKHFSLAGSLDPATGATASVRLEHDDPEMMRRYLRSFGEPVRVTLESTGNWYWLVDLAEEEGAQVRLANNVETRRLLKARAKNDRLDALALALLSAEEILPEVYVPPRELRDGRERHRYRIRLIWMRCRIKNVIHAILGKLNIEHPFSDLFGKAGRAFLDDLELREPYETELRSALRLLDAFDAEVELMRGEIRDTLRENPLAAVVQTAPGIAELTAYLILYEVGPVERFPSEKEFVSYCCLAPGTWQSAERRRDMPIGRHGNLYLKTAFVEAAQTAVRVDPHLGAFYKRLRRRKGTGKAIAATARKLAIAVYYMVKRGRAYRPAPRIFKGSGKPVSRFGRK